MGQGVVGDAQAPGEDLDGDVRGGVGRRSAGAVPGTRAQVVGVETGEEVLDDRAAALVGGALGEPDGGPAQPAQAADEVGASGADGTANRWSARTSRTPAWSRTWSGGVMR
ncbi:hypothetical protein BJF83_01535 [Nocardiopsis sp. CNR-923]|uniref:hypothetical protein n=1 Tax=Nocardiopsis sp. CNR-923 TaxID=1904965 RepID=UPI000964703D|nr:hypothetical protein [Nocardiopsis sp. CNR-923]OLT28178.1 hypothetical protein BJF83_01535 [Nocardiopsis sp. CNR-923]